MKVVKMVSSNGSKFKFTNGLTTYEFELLKNNSNNSSAKDLNRIAFTVYVGKGSRPLGDVGDFQCGRVRGEISKWLDANVDGWWYLGTEQNEVDRALTFFLHFEHKEALVAFKTYYGGN